MSRIFILAFLTIFWSALHLNPAQSEVEDRSLKQRMPSRSDLQTQSAVQSKAYDPLVIAATKNCLQLAQAHIRKGQFTEALKYLSQGLELTPDDRTLSTARIDLLCKMNRPEEALTLILQSSGVENDSYLLFKEIKILNELKRYDEALKCCDQLDELKPEPVRHHQVLKQPKRVVPLDLVCIQRAKILESKGDHSAAVDEAKKAYRVVVESFSDPSKVNELMQSLNCEPPAMNIPPQPLAKYNPALDKYLFEGYGHFDRQMWRLKKHRKEMLTNLVASYPIIGMTDGQVQELLGEPEHYPFVTSKADLYTLEESRSPFSRSFCGTGYDGTTYLQFNYSETGLVQSIEVRHGHRNIAGYGWRSQILTTNKASSADRNTKTSN